MKNLITTTLTFLLILTPLLTQGELNVFSNYYKPLDAILFSIDIESESKVFHIQENAGESEYELNVISYTDSSPVDSLACNFTSLVGEKRNTLFLLSDVSRGGAEYVVGEDAFYFAVRLMQVGRGDENLLIGYNLTDNECFIAWRGDYRTNEASIGIDNMHSTLYFSSTVEKYDNGTNVHEIIALDTRTRSYNTIGSFDQDDVARYLSGFTVLEEWDTAFFVIESWNTALFEVWGANKTSVWLLGSLDYRHSEFTHPALLIDKENKVLAFRSQTGTSLIQLVSETEFTSKYIPTSNLVDYIQFLDTGVFLYYDNAHGLAYRDITSSGFPRTLNNPTVQVNDTVLVAESSGYLVHQSSPTSISLLSIANLENKTIVFPGSYTANIKAVNDLKGQVLLSVSNNGDYFIYVFSFDDLTTPISITSNAVDFGDAVDINVDEKRSILLFRRPIDGLYRLHYEDCKNQGLYGEYCAKSCNCIESNTIDCFEGVLGNGSCTCFSNYTGELCENCNSGYFGNEIEPPVCYLCTCLHGVCDEGNDGHGTCNCTGNWAGESCDECKEGWKGANCESEVGTVSQIVIDDSTSTSETTSSTTSMKTSSSTSSVSEVSSSTESDQGTTATDGQQNESSIVFPLFVSILLSMVL